MEAPVPRPAADVLGKRFGRLVVIKRLASPLGDRRSLWRCHCDCGKTAIVAGGALTAGRTKSCGCWRREFPVATKTTHGYRHTRLYGVWRGMKSRCQNPNQPHYPRYGGRGIKVCDRWQKFENFLADMGESPGPAYSLERIDNDGNYEPGNVRWASRSEQRANARTGTKGSRHGMAKLTEKDVRAIRESTLTGAQLARAFKMSQSVISAIRRAKTWKHVT